MRRLLALTLLLVLTLAAACDDDFGGRRVAGSGRIETVSFDLRDFTELAASSSFQVEVTAGSEFEVVVRTDDNVVELLIVEVRGDRLVLGIEGSVSLRDVTLEASVSVPDLVRLEASGASRVDLFDFTSRVDRVIDASGASEVQGVVNALELDVRLSGASRAVLAGAVDRLELDLSGASRVALRELTAREARIELSGASSGTVTVLGTIERVGLSGASSLTYHGDPVLEDVSTSGASTIRRG